MDETKEMLREEFREPEARHDYADMFLDSSIALQIKSLRLQRDWTQKELAEGAGLHQSQISKMEQITNSSWTLETLKKLAKAFDLSLRVSFESFGTLLDEYVNQSRNNFERDSFADDPVFRRESEMMDAERTGDAKVLFPNFERVKQIKATGAGDGWLKIEGGSSG